jgi:hypothetical protein
MNINCDVDCGMRNIEKRRAECGVKLMKLLCDDLKFEVDALTLRLKDL